MPYVKNQTMFNCGNKNVDEGSTLWKLDQQEICVRILVDAFTPLISTATSMKIYQRTLIDIGGVIYIEELIQVDN